ncbi:MAG: hypothetical protein ACYCT7_10040 [bacterium]
MTNNKIKIKYKINPAHRNSNPNKSQWVINKIAERNLFKLVYNSNWIYPDNNGIKLVSA